jgi:hypothetical protein
LSFELPLHDRATVLARPSPVPKVPGIYAWCFREVPPDVPVQSCVRVGGLPVLYVGISPSAPPMNGKQPSKQSLRRRICYHFRGNAAGSTLRLTLGCLLSIELRRVGSGDRLTFGPAGEAILSEWMHKNALVTWLSRDAPWQDEGGLIADLKPPLNLQGNRDHAFHKKLSELRANAKARARSLPILA